MKKLFFLSIFVIGLCGCALTRSTVTVHDVVLLPEERIFTVPAGQLINVELDGKPMQMTFPHPMKLVYEIVLVRKEEALTDQVQKAIKAEKDKNDLMKVAGGIISLLGGIIWWMARRKKLVNIEQITKIQA
jgi:hypothetical protein